MPSSVAEPILNQPVNHLLITAEHMERLLQNPDFVEWRRVVLINEREELLLKFKLAPNHLRAFQGALTMLDKIIGAPERILRKAREDRGAETEDP